MLDLWRSFSLVFGSVRLLIDSLSPFLSRLAALLSLLSTSLSVVIDGVLERRYELSNPHHRSMLGARSGASSREVRVRSEGRGSLSGESSVVKRGGK